MKFRPLFIDYHADAVSRLEETKSDATNPHQIVVHPASGDLESESECESVHEARRVPPPQLQAFQRSLSPLNDDASFTYMDEDRLQDAEDEGVQNVRESRFKTSASAPQANELVACPREKLPFRDSVDRHPRLDDDDSSDSDDRINGIEKDVTVSSSESKCESVDEEEHLPPPPRQAFKRSLSPLDKDASLAYMNDDPLQDTDDEVDQNDRESRSKFFARAPLANVVSAPRRRRLSFRDSVSRRSAFDDQGSNDNDDSMDGIQKGISVESKRERGDKEKRSTLPPRQTFKRSRLPLNDDASFTDVKDDPFQDIDDDIEQKVRDVLAFRDKTVSFRDSALDADDSSDDNDWLEDIENDVQVKSSRGWDLKRKLKEVRKAETEDVTVVEEMTSGVDAAPQTNNNFEPSIFEKFGSHGGLTAAMDTTASLMVARGYQKTRESPPSPRIKRTITPVDPQVMTSIFQGLRDALLNKRIGSAPHQFSTFYYGNMKNARLAFWRVCLMGGIATSSSWFYDMVAIKDVLQLDQLLGMAASGRRMQQPLLCTEAPVSSDRLMHAVDMLHDGNFASFAPSVSDSGSLESRALVPYEPKSFEQEVAVPSVWMDLIKAIMVMREHHAHAIVTTMMDSDVPRTDSHPMRDSRGPPLQPAIQSETTQAEIGGARKPTLKRHFEGPLEEHAPPRASGEDRTKPSRIDIETPAQQCVESDSVGKPKRKSRKHRKSGDHHKADRRERKRRKKEKKERKERKRKSGGQEETRRNAFDDRNKSILRAPLGTLKDANAAKRTFQVDRAGHVDERPLGTKAGRGTEKEGKRLKLQHVPLGEILTHDTTVNAFDTRVSSTDKDLHNNWQAGTKAVSAGYNQGEAIPSEAPMVATRRFGTKENETLSTDRVSNSRPSLKAPVDNDFHLEGRKARRADKKRKKEEKEEKRRKRSRVSHGERAEKAVLEDQTTRAAIDASKMIEDVSTGDVPLANRLSANDREGAAFSIPFASARPVRTASDGESFQVASEYKRTGAVADSAGETDNQNVSRDESPAAMSEFPHIGNGARTRESTDANTAVQQSRSSVSLDHTPALTALCSESFLEGWSEATALLASGQWASSCQPVSAAESVTEINEESPGCGRKVQLFDTPILDDAGIDIELPGGHAMVIYRLSSLQSSEDALVLARKLARLTGLGRYRQLDIILCADVEISASLSLDISFVENAVIRQTGSQCCSPCFQMIASPLVATVIASRVLNSQEQQYNSMDLIINGSITDTGVEERVRFLLSIAPSLTVCGALQCLGRLSDGDRDGDFSRVSFQRLMGSGDTRAGHGNLVETEISSLHQLSFAINVALSNDG